MLAMASPLPVLPAHESCLGAVEHYQRGRGATNGPSKAVGVSLNLKYSWVNFECLKMQLLFVLTLQILPNGVIIRSGVTGDGYNGEEVVPWAGDEGGLLGQRRWVARAGRQRVRGC